MKPSKWRLTDFDPRILRWICLAGMVILAPFAIRHALRGDRLTFALVGGLIPVMAATAWQIWRDPDSFSPGSLLAGMVLCNVVVTVAGLRLQSEGMYRGFATIGANSFLLGPRLGLVYSACLGIAMVTTATRWAESSELLRFAAGFTLLVVMVYLFSSRVGRKQDELARLFLTDSLTGVGNRRSLNVALAQELTKARRYMASLIAIDLDHFKTINDAHGHATGDHFLLEFARMVE